MIHVTRKLRRFLSRPFGYRQRAGTASSQIVRTMVASTPATPLAKRAGVADRPGEEEDSLTGKSNGIAKGGIGHGCRAVGNRQLTSTNNAPHSQVPQLLYKTIEAKEDFDDENGITAL